MPAGWALAVRTQPSKPARAEAPRETKRESRGDDLRIRRHHGSGLAEWKGFVSDSGNGGAPLDTATDFFSLSHDAGVGQGWGEGNPFAFAEQCSALLNRLFSNPLGEAFHADDSALVESSNDEFALVMRFDLEGDLAALDADDSCGAPNRLADRRGGQMANLDFNADGSLVVLEAIGERLARRAFEETHEVRRGQNGGHAAFGKVDGVHRFYLEAQFSDGSNFRAGFHLAESNRNRIQIDSNRPIRVRGLCP